MREQAEGRCREAMLYDRLSGGRVRCNLCHHHCVISDGKRGVCQVRENRGQTLFTLVYGRTIAQHVDPVEKKPLFHFYPGSNVREDADTFCPACGELLIRRSLMQVADNRVQPEARCPRCGATVAGVGMSCQDSSDS